MVVFVVPLVVANEGNLKAKQGVSFFISFRPISPYLLRVVGLEREAFIRFRQHLVPCRSDFVNCHLLCFYSEREREQEREHTMVKDRTEQGTQDFVSWFLFSWERMQGMGLRREA